MLHLDDLAEIEHQGKKLNILLAMKNTNPTSHYLMLVVRKDNLAKNRDAIVRTVAGLIEAARFMQDPKNADAVADAASVTGHSKDVNKLRSRNSSPSTSGRPRMTACRARSWKPSPS